METYPLALALFDFVPVTLFLVGAFFLVRIALQMHGSSCGRMAMAGSFLVFLGGFLKATWKLLYTTNVADLRWMSEVQFALVALGFLALLVSVILMAKGRQSPAVLLLGIAPWKIPLLVIMTLSSMGAQGILAYLSFRRRVPLAAAGFIVAFLCLVAMGSMASSEQTIAKQWIEETINTIGQMGFLLGTILLDRNVRQSGCE